MRRFLPSHQYMCLVVQEQTQSAIQDQIQGNVLKVTQGFIASDMNNFTTTLGREGSSKAFT